MAKIKDFFLTVFAFSIIGYGFYKLGHRVLEDHYLKKNIIRIKAVIIDEKNDVGNHNVAGKFSHSYRFTVDGNTYTNDSHDQSLAVGDSIEIEYAKGMPGFNRPVRDK